MTGAAAGGAPPTARFASWAIALAVAAPVSMAFARPPSASMLRQLLALFLWGVAVAAIATVAGDTRVPWRRVRPLYAALLLLAAGATGTWVLLGTLAAPTVATLCTLAAAALGVAAGARAACDPQADALWAGFFAGWVIAALLGTAAGAVQVLAPELSGGVVLAAKVAGRAHGNVGQPNHLAAVLLWGLASLGGLVVLGRLRPRTAAVLGALFVGGIVLSGSRTGALGLLLIALWGAVDRRLPRGLRLALGLSPLLFAGLEAALTAWGRAHEVGAGVQHVLRSGDPSSSRFGVWAQALELLRRVPWTGVGYNELDTALSLTPTAHRHPGNWTNLHNLPLQLVVELGLPLGGVLVAALAWGAGAAARAAGRTDGALGGAARAGAVAVALVGVHSLLEFPLWFAYFLLPTAFAWGAVLATGAARVHAPPGLRPMRLAGVALAAGAFLGFADYTKVHALTVEAASAAQREERLEAARHAWFYAAYAHYVDATQSARPRPQAFPSGRLVATSPELLIAWSRERAAAGDLERARHLAARAREFGRGDDHGFFADCERGEAPRPVQCIAPQRALDWRDFR